MLATACAAGCSFDPAGRGSGVGPDGAPRDGGNSIDGAPVGDGSVPPGERHLLLSEVKTHPQQWEFVEIFNPRCDAVALDGYHLTDEPRYPLLPAWAVGGMPTLSTQDAVLRFPAGETLETAETIVVARDGTSFFAAYGVEADYAVINSRTLAMEIVVQGPTADFSFRNEGEALALFVWDGESDLVADVDVVVVGEAPADGDGLVAKTTLAPDGVDGPDADAIATAYFADAVTLLPMARRDTSPLATSGAYQRITGEAGDELGDDGNGLGGHDETSEDTRMTWEQTLLTTPTPGEVPDALRAPCVSP